jgi:AsmA protein
MTERRPPPSLGTYRPTQDNDPDPGRGTQDAAWRIGAPGERTQPSQSGAPPVRTAPPAPAPQHMTDGDALPRIITTRVRDDAGRALQQIVPAPRRTNGGTQNRRPPPRPEREGMSWLRLTTYVLFGGVAFVTAAAAAALFLVPTDLIRSRVAAEVKARTGRDLVFAGRPALTLWPRPAVSLKDVSLSGPPAMGGQTLISVGEIEVAVQILPLLLHDVTIDRLILRKPVLDLHVDTSGRRSWDFAEVLGQPVRLAQAAAPNAVSGKALPQELRDFVKGATDSVPERPERAAGGGKSRISDVTLGNVSVIDGTVRYRDERAGVDETATAVNATFAMVNIASPLESKGSLVWRGEPVQLTAQLTPFRALLDGRPIQAQAKVTAAPVSMTFEGTAAFAPELDLDGRVDAKVASIDRLAQWTGRPLASGVPGGIAVEGKLKQSALMTALSDARVSVGPVAANGAISIDNRGARPFVKGALQVATLDLNALRLIAEATPAQAAAPAVATKAVVPAAGPSAAPKSIEELLEAAPAVGAQKKPQVRGYTKREGWSDEVIDLSALGLADAEVRLGFDKVLWQEVVTGAGQVALSVKAKTARLTFEDLQLYGGRARGIVTVDATAKEPTLGGNFVADGVSALPMLKALSDFDWMAGKARIAVAVAGRGATERQLVSTMNGKADIAITDGALIGYDISALTRGLGQGRMPNLERNTKDKTDFSEFAASALITNGVARNDDLRLTSGQVKASGAGTIDLPSRTMDYVLKPKVQGGVELPLKISGALDKPTVAADVGGLLRDPGAAMQAVQDAAKTPAGREVQETVKGLLQGNPDARAKAKGFLDQLLKQ